MLKDEKGNLVKTLEISEDLWKRIIQEIRNGVLIDFRVD
jgi:hypothetical protein